MYNDVNISVLMGKTITKIDRPSNPRSRDEIVFTLEDGSQYKMYHSQDCCESVQIEDIEGDLADLVGTPITMAEESTNSNEPPAEGADSSYLWTYYRLATVKGYVTIRWFGTSNGFYSESVEFVKI